MDEAKALTIFAALAQETRLRILRLLVKAGPEGLAAGSIADAMGVSASNVSFHLKELDHSGLISARRESRSIVYAADFDTIGGVLRFLMEDCCGGHPDICGPAIQSMSCCPPAQSQER